MSPDHTGLKYFDQATRQLLQHSSDSIHGYVASPLNIKGIVCIGAWGRSGSGLMSSMVDNHPEIVQIYPQHGLMAVYFEVLPTVQYSESAEETVNAIVERFANVKGHSARWTSLIEERAGVFAEVLAHHLRLQRKAGAFTRRNVFLATHGAYAFAMDCLPKTDRPLIIWQSHANDFAMRRRVREDFPEARFIVMARYPPRARDSALLAFSEALPKALPLADDHHFHQDPFSVSLKNLIQMNEMGRNLFPEEDIVAIRFEDLHMRTRQTMQWLSRWLGIEWNASLLESTLRGAPWGKHSMYPVYGSLYNVGTRVLSREDYYTRGQSRFDLIKYRAYQDEFMNAWSYAAAPLSPIAKFIALRILCYWPVKVQWRTLWTLLRKATQSKTEVVREFVRHHFLLVTEFSMEYTRQRTMLQESPVIAKAPINAISWPGRIPARPPMLIWITGLPGSGKTEIARALEMLLRRKAPNGIVLLDGDDIRSALGISACYLPDERLALARTYGRLCRLLLRQGYTVICATVSMFEAVRAENRAKATHYFEVFVQADDAVRLSRKPELGGYHREDLVSVGGVSYQLPQEPDLVLENNGSLKPTELAQLIVEKLKK